MGQSRILKKGFSLMGLAGLIVIMGIMTMTFNIYWSTTAKREKEGELAHRLQAIMRALNYYSQLTGGQSPDKLEDLAKSRVSGRLLLREYCLIDPITNQPFSYEKGRLVFSESQDKSITGVKYSDWLILKCSSVDEKGKKSTKWELIRKEPVKDEDELGLFDEKEDEEKIIDH